MLNLQPRHPHPSWVLGQMPCLHSVVHAHHRMQKISADVGWLLQCRPGSPRASNAERYSLMRRLTVTEPDANTLELCFDTTGKEGAARLAPKGRQPRKAIKRLQQLSILPCAATELKVRRLLSSNS